MDADKSIHHSSNTAFSFLSHFDLSPVFPVTACTVSPFFSLSLLQYPLFPLKYDMVERLERQAFGDGKLSSVSLKLLFAIKVNERQLQQFVPLSLRGVTSRW